MFKVVIAPDSFKGSLSAKEACDAIEIGLKNVSNIVEIIKVPMADGGEGTLETLVNYKNGRLISKEVLDPLGKKIEASLGFLEDNTCIIEMANASGLPLVSKDKRNPLITTTYGTGQLIKHGLDLGARRFIIGIGGSATVDGGSGMLQALGIKLLDEAGNSIGFGGGSLNELRRIDFSTMDSRLRESEILVACDVDNPLLGAKGAAEVFGPQKGATEDMVSILEKNLSHYSKIVTRSIGKDYSNIPGTGAAGGLGFALVSILQSKLLSGVDIIIDETNLEKHIKDANLVITGEGKTDAQTLRGKVPIGVAKIAKKYDVPVVVLTGTIDDSIKEIYEHGITTVFSIVKAPSSIEYAMENAYSLLSDASERLFRLILKTKG